MHIASAISINHFKSGISCLSPGSRPLVLDDPVSNRLFCSPTDYQHTKVNSASALWGVNDATLVIFECGRWRGHDSYNRHLINNALQGSRACGSKNVGLSDIAYRVGCLNFSIAGLLFRNVRVNWFLSKVVPGEKNVSMGNGTTTATPYCLKEAIRTVNKKLLWEINSWSLAWYELLIVSFNLTHYSKGIGWSTGTLIFHRGDSTIGPVIISCR